MWFAGRRVRRRRGLLPGRRGLRLWHLRLGHLLLGLVLPGLLMVERLEIGGRLIGFSVLPRGSLRRRVRDGRLGIRVIVRFASRFAAGRLFDGRSYRLTRSRTQI